MFYQIIQPTNIHSPTIAAAFFAKIDGTRIKPAIIDFYFNKAPFKGKLRKLFFNFFFVFRDILIVTFR